MNPDLQCTIQKLKEIDYHRGDLLQAMWLSQTHQKQKLKEKLKNSDSFLYFTLIHDNNPNQEDIEKLRAFIQREKNSDQYQQLIIDSQLLVAQAILHFEKSKAGIKSVKEIILDVLNKIEVYPYKYSMLAYFQIASLEKDQNILKAKRYLIKAIQFKPNFNPAVQLLYSILVRENSEEAYVLVKKVIKVCNNKSYLFQLQARHQIQKKQFDQAIPSLLTALKLSETKLEEEKEYEKLQLYFNFEEISSSISVILMQLSECYFQQNKQTNALQAILKCFKLWAGPISGCNNDTELIKPDTLFFKRPTNAKIVEIVLNAKYLKIKESHIALFSLARILHHLSKFFWSNWVIVQLVEICIEEKVLYMTSSLFIRNIIHLKKHYLEIGYNSAIYEKLYQESLHFLLKVIPQEEQVNNPALQCALKLFHFEFAKQKKSQEKIIKGSLDSAVLLVKNNQLQEAENKINQFIYKSDQQVKIYEWQRIVLMKLYLLLKQSKNDQLQYFINQAHIHQNDQEFRKKLLSLLIAKELNLKNFPKTMELLKEMKNLSPYDSTPWLLSALIILIYIQSTKLKGDQISTLLRQGLSFLEQGLTISPEKRKEFELIQVIYKFANQKYEDFIDTEQPQLKIISILASLRIKFGSEASIPQFKEKLTEIMKILHIDGSDLLKKSCEIKADQDESKILIKLRLAALFDNSINLIDIIRIHENVESKTQEQLLKMLYYLKEKNLLSMNEKDNSEFDRLFREFRKRKIMQMNQDRNINFNSILQSAYSEGYHFALCIYKEAMRLLQMREYQKLEDLKGIIMSYNAMRSAKSLEFILDVINALIQKQNEPLNHPFVKWIFEKQNQFNNKTLIEVDKGSLNSVQQFQYIQFLLCLLDRSGYLAEKSVALRFLLSNVEQTDYPELLLKLSGELALNQLRLSKPASALKILKEIKEKSHHFISVECIKLMIYRRLKKVKEVEDTLYSIAELEVEEKKEKYSIEEHLVINFIKILIQLEAKNKSAKKLLTLQEVAQDLISEFHNLSQRQYSANLRALVYGAAAWSIEELVGIAQDVLAGQQFEREGLIVKKRIYIGLALKTQPAIGEVLMKHVLF